MLNNKENYSKIEVEQAKREIQSLVKEKSKHVKIDFRNKNDVLEFFDNE
jgi:DNA-damage-inducible protein J